jgi:autotransporter-associated beta strand protein
MAKLYNLARMTTATTGTGTITLGAAVSGYLTFALAGIADGDVIDYAVKDGTNSEIGTGTYAAAATTLTRAVTRSTNSNSPISLSGTAEVFISPRAETLFKLDQANIVSGGNTFTGSNTFSGGVVINGGALQSSVQNLFSGTSGTGTHQFTTNSGTSATVINPPGTGMPFWFIATDATTPGGAGFSLHRSGAYALNVGLDTDNYVRIGGWSDGVGVQRFSVGPAGDGYFTRSLGVGQAASGVAGDIKSKVTAKAWVNCNGTNGAIIDSFNVSSVTRTVAGGYTVNIATALSNANYAVVGMGSGSASWNGWLQLTVTPARTTTAFYVGQLQSGGGALYDPPTFSVAAFGSS